MELTLLSTIRADIRSRTDTETSTPTVDHITDAELTRWIQQAYREMMDYIIAKGGDDAIDLLAVSTTLTAPFTLPANRYRIVSVDAAVDGFDRQLTRQAWRTRQRRQSGTRATPTWRAVGDQLQFFPSTAAPAAVTVWYIGNFPDDDHDTAVTTLNGWDEFLIASAAIKVCEKEEMDDAKFVRARGDALLRIKEAVAALAVTETQGIIAETTFAADYD